MGGVGTDSDLLTLAGIAALASAAVPRAARPGCESDPGVHPSVDIAEIA